MQIGDRIHRDDFAGVNDDDLAAGLFDFRQDVSAENDGVVAGKAGDELAGLALLLRIKAGGGFIKDENRRVMNDRLSDADALTITLRKLSDDRVALRSRWRCDRTPHRRV